MEDMDGTWLYVGAKYDVLVARMHRKENVSTHALGSTHHLNNDIPEAVSI